VNAGRLLRHHRWCQHPLAETWHLAQLPIQGGIATFEIDGSEPSTRTTSLTGTASGSEDQEDRGQRDNRSKHVSCEDRSPTLFAFLLNPAERFANLLDNRRGRLPDWFDADPIFVHGDDFDRPDAPSAAGTTTEGLAADGLRLFARPTTCCEANPMLIKGMTVLPSMLIGSPTTVRVLSSRSISPNVVFSRFSTCSMITSNIHWSLWHDLLDHHHSVVRRRPAR
jgi:hypothetical protein